jgi:hypothetical protein
MHIFNTFVRIATFLDLGYKYLRPPTATDKWILEIHQSVGQLARLETEIKLLVKEVKRLQQAMEAKTKAK